MYEMLKSLAKDRHFLFHKYTWTRWSKSSLRNWHLCGNELGKQEYRTKSQYVNSTWKNRASGPEGKYTMVIL